MGLCSEGEGGLCLVVAVVLVKEKVVLGGEDDKKNYLFIFWSEKK